MTREDILLAVAVLAYVLPMGTSVVVGLWRNGWDFLGLSEEFMPKEDPNGTD